MKNREELLQEYAKIKLNIASLNRELSLIKQDVFSIVFDEDDQKLETEFGKFELRAGKKKWNYSDALLAKEEQVKEALKLKRKQEELQNIAVLEKAPTNLVFIAHKG